MTRAYTNNFRCDRIRVIRLRLIIHARRAEHSRIAKGSQHFDTIHAFEIVDELVSSLNREIQMQKEDETEMLERMSDVWEKDIMDRIDDV